MPHCTKCGAEIPASAQFCQTCGQPQAGPASTPPAWQPSAAAQGTGLSENTAAALSYALGWITGVIFFLIDKRPYVRFHAAQSIVTFGGLHLISIVLKVVFGLGWAFGGYVHMGYGTWGSFGIGLALLSLLGILCFVLWIVCIIKAASGSRFMVPIAGPIAENLARQ
jgi:uncharacterized membrane protein